MSQPGHTATEATPADNRSGGPAEDDPDGALAGTSSQVAWWPVHEFVAAVLDQANGWPMAGTPVWCSLAHDDPRKWAALLDAAQHHVLRIEVAQQARVDASRAISAAADWAAVGREINRRTEFYAARPWLRRRPQ